MGGGENSSPSPSCVLKMSEHPAVKFAHQRLRFKILTSMLALMLFIISVFLALMTSFKLFQFCILITGPGIIQRYASDSVEFPIGIHYDRYMFF